MDNAEILAFVMGLGLLGMFGIAVFEKLVPIVPSYLILLTLGSAALSEKDVILALVATAAGSVLGTLCLYSLGRVFGEARVVRAVTRYGAYVFCPMERYQALAGAYRRNNFLVTLCGQLIPIARIYLAIPAGVLRLNSLQFLLASAIGIVTYNSLFLAIGFALRDATHDPLTLGATLTVVLVLLELLAFWYIRRRRRLRPASAAAGQTMAEPGDSARGG